MDDLQIRNLRAGDNSQFIPGRIEIASSADGTPGYLKLNSFISNQSVYLFAQSNKSLRISDTPPDTDTSGNPLVSASSGGNLSFISISCTRSGSENKLAGEEISIFGTSSYLENTVSFQINNSLQFSESDYNTISGEINIQQHAYYIISLNYNILSVSSNKIVKIEIQSKSPDSASYTVLQTYQTSLNEASSSENSLVTIAEISSGTLIKAVVTLMDTTNDIIITTGIGTSINIYSISDTAAQFILSSMKKDSLSVDLDSTNNLVKFSYPKNAVVDLTSTDVANDLNQIALVIDAYSRLTFKNITNSSLYTNNSIVSNEVTSAYLYPAIVNNELGLYWGNTNLAKPNQMKNGNVNLALETNPIDQIKFTTSIDSIGTLIRGDQIFLPNGSKTISTHTDDDFGILSYNGSSLLLNGAGVVSSTETLTNANETARIRITSDGIVHTVTTSDSHIFRIDSNDIFSAANDFVRVYRPVLHNAISEYNINSSYYFGTIGDNKYIQYHGKVQLSLSAGYLTATINVLDNNTSSYTDRSLFTLTNNNKSKCNVQLTLDYEVTNMPDQAPKADHMLYVKEINLTTSTITVKSVGTWSEGIVYPFVHWSLHVNLI
tara:strand:- start:5998 stop:7815 length:1818 start_codon:yes stop_codon:yes gene_type:complete